MTLPNVITIGRILLIPVFVMFAIYYSEGVAAGTPREALRYAAITAFGVAALSDVVDGWIARHFAQESALGRVLDPLADKLLLVSALLTLSFSAWPAPLPLWFVVICITREVLLAAGALVVEHVAGKLRVQPHWTGKLATFLQVTAIAASMLRLDGILPWTAVAAAVFTVLSGLLYLADAGGQVKAAGPG